MELGIVETKKVVHAVFGVIISGVKIAKSFSAVVPEVQNLSFAEIVEIVTTVATAEVPALIEAIKA